MGSRGRMLTTRAAVHTHLIVFRSLKAECDLTTILGQREANVWRRFGWHSFLGNCCRRYCFFWVLDNCSLQVDNIFKGPFN